MSEEDTVGGERGKNINTLPRLPQLVDRKSAEVSCMPEKKRIENHLAFCSWVYLMCIGI